MVLHITPYTLHKEDSLPTSTKVDLRPPGGIWMPISYFTLTSICSLNYMSWTPTTDFEFCTLLFVPCWVLRYCTWSAHWGDRLTGATKYIIRLSRLFYHYEDICILLLTNMKLSWKPVIFFQGGIFRPNRPAFNIIIPYRLDTLQLTQEKEKSSG